MKAAMMSFLAKSSLAKGFLAKALVIAVMVTSVMAVMPGASEASAYGIQYWGGFSVNVGGQTVRIPAGQLAHWISGNGLYVSWDGANFASVGCIGDPSMRFTYGYGRVRVNGSVHWGCSHVGQWKYWIQRNEPRGSACAELWAHDWRILVARQCHFVS
jgi:hypothetical protein